jgi:hypothetical protein
MMVDGRWLMVPPQLCDFMVKIRTLAKNEVDCGRARALRVGAGGAVRKRYER